MIKLKPICQENMPSSETTEYVICPFCKESDFDLIGLKTHLEHGDCEIYNNTETRTRLF